MTQEPQEQDDFEWVVPPRVPTEAELKLAWTHWPADSRPDWDEFVRVFTSLPRAHGASAGWRQRYHQVYQWYTYWSALRTVYQHRQVLISLLSWLWWLG